ncbi:hypothetical protein [Streptomyces sp. NPDC015131]|uniref:hypothetical protein n=1 Tax=Streptomyces sp. NPDC015131 TaxID=3364941 RepID=UPI0036F9F12F
MSRARKAKIWAWVHVALAVVWMALVVPTMLWWKDSILWVLLISIYANIVGHWSAYQAAKAEESGETNPPQDGSGQDAKAPEPDAAGAWSATRLEPGDADYDEEYPWRPHLAVGDDASVVLPVRCRSEGDALDFIEKYIVDKGVNE